MPPAPTRYPYLSQKFNKQVLRLPVPKAQQAILGRPMFRMVMPQADAQSAHVASLPILSEWKRQIAAAKDASRDVQQAEVLRLRIAFEQHAGKPLDAAAQELFDAILDFLFQRFGGMSAVAQRLALAEAKGDANQALRALPAPAEARQMLAVITGQESPATPFLANLEAFKATCKVQVKARDQMVAEVRQFARAVPMTLEALQAPGAGKAVQDWIDSLVQRGLRSSSFNHKIGSLQSYWQWLYKRELVRDDIGPFYRRDLRDGRSGVEKAKVKRLPFSAWMVPRLWSRADFENDTMLSATIQIAAHSGLRRDGVCSLTVDSIEIDEETGIRCFMVNEKTASGVRQIPIHSAISPLIDRLVKHPDRDGYLIHNAGIDHYGYRGREIGKRFITLKTGMGYSSEQYDFHSLRHTFQSGLETKGVRIKVIKNLIGHKVADITQGRYGVISPLVERRDAIEMLSYP